MKLAQFLARLHEGEKFGNVCLCSSEYQLLLIAKVLALLQSSSGYKKVFLDPEVMSVSQAKAQLEMTFLGQQRLYWLGDISAWSGKALAQWSAYVAAYTGPHSIVWLSAQPIDNATVRTVEFPRQIDHKTFKTLLPLWPETERERIAAFVQRLFSQNTVLTFEQLVLLIEYGLVVGAGRDDFMREWLPMLVPLQGSLFALSGALFSQDLKAFALLWDTAKEQYPPQFWLAYFSEQVFRAYCFVQAKREQSDTRKISLKLPFSFIQRDWQLAKPLHLLTAHAQLCNLDWHLKNGGSDQLLDGVLFSIAAG